MDKDSTPLVPPKPVVHNDSIKSALPEREDRQRQQGPNDPPESKRKDETPVG